MRRTGINAWTAVIVLLVVVGVWDMLSSNPLSLLIPVVILGGIFAFYWFSPARRGRAVKPRARHTGYGRSDARHKTSPSKTRARKQSSFRVIDGGKDEDGMPKYH